MCVLCNKKSVAWHNWGKSEKDKKSKSTMSFESQEQSSAVVLPSVVVFVRSSPVWLKPEDAEEQEEAAEEEQVFADACCGCSC